MQHYCINKACLTSRHFHCFSGKNLPGLFFKSQVCIFKSPNPNFQPGVCLRVCVLHGLHICLCVSSFSHSITRLYVHHRKTNENLITAPWISWMILLQLVLSEQGTGLISSSSGSQVLWEKAHLIHVPPGIEPLLGLWDHSILRHQLHSTQLQGWNKEICCGEISKQVRNVSS